MEKLADLPPTEETEMTPKEEEVMNKFFGSKPSKSSSSSTSMGWRDLTKITVYAAILFVALANPWVDNLLCSIPYGCGDNVLLLLGAKALIFMLLFVVIYKFLVAN